MRTIALALVVDVLVTTPCISDMPVGYFGNAGLMSGQGINTATLDGNPVLSSDGLALYFTSDRDSGGQGIADIFRATRETENAPFGNVERLGGGVNTPFQEIPSFVETSVDGITTLWFTSDRPNGYGGRDLYSATMQPGEDTFGNVQNMGETVNTQYEDRTAFFSSDRLSFYFYSNRPGTEGQFDIYRSVRPSLDAPFDTPIRLSGPINGPGWDGGNISLSSDELYLFFYSNSPRPRNDFALDIWIAARSSVESEFDTAMNLNDFSLGSAVNVDGDIEATPHVSRDWPANGSKLYYLTIQRNNNPGFLDWNVWEATWTQVDVSSNGVLDVTDIDDLALAIREESDERRFDLNHDGQVDGFDSELLVVNAIGTWFGDSNLDGVFNTSDLVTVFQEGQYEDGIDGNSSWTTGDWNGDGEFDTGDLVLAFQDGGFEVGPRQSVASVPEPSSTVGLFTAFVFASLLGRRLFHL